MVKPPDRLSKSLVKFSDFLLDINAPLMDSYSSDSLPLSLRAHLMYPLDRVK
jgi:hypothetical protein